MVAGARRRSDRRCAEHPRLFAALPGASEANPLIAAAQAHLGSAWWLPKVGVALMLILLLRYRPQRRMVLVISLVSTVPSLVNLANLWWG